MSTAINYPHITTDAKGTAYLAGSRYKVLHLATEHYHLGWSAEELLRQHSDLRPEEVYAALTYFYDHFNELVNEIRQRAGDAAALRTDKQLSRAELLARKPQ